MTPDEVVLPTAPDLASGAILIRLMLQLGVRLSTEEVGKLFPYEWPPDTR